MEDATRIKYASEGLVLRSIPSGTDHPLQGEMLVGREVECAITLPSNQASRYHAKINVSANGTYVEDLHSTNGTYVNGKKTRGRILLCIGDEVTFDDIAFRFASLNSGAEDATTLNPRRTVPQIKPAPPKPLRTPSKAPPSSPSPAAVINIEPEKVVEKVDQNNHAWAHENIEEAKAKNSEAAEENSNTQMISSTHMNRLIERNKGDIEVSIGSGPRLIVMTAPLRGKLFELDEALVGTRWQIGRGENSNIILNDKTISTNHALLNKTPQGFTLNAINAKNGIIINGIKQKQVLLKHNDKVQIGRTELLFRTDEPAREQAHIKQKPYVELKSGRYAMVSTIATIAVIVAAIYFTPK